MYKPDGSRVRTARDVTVATATGISRPLRALGSILAAVVLVSAGCSVKRTVDVAVPAGIREARTAGFEELASLLRDRDRGITSLSSTSLQVTFTSGRIESGKLQEYRSAPGYVLLKRPDSIRVSIQNPITKTTILELLSVGDDFSIWYPRENKFYIGKNSAREFDLEGSPSFTVRPIHMLQALMPQDVSAGPPDSRIAMEEDQDANARYYVLSLYETLAGPALYPKKKLWIDRANFAVARQQSYEEGGALAGIVYYSNMSLVDGTLLPLGVRMERSADGYSLDMRFKDWRLNPDLPDTAFVMAPPGGAQIVVLKEKAPSSS